MPCLDTFANIVTAGVALAAFWVAIRWRGDFLARKRAEVAGQALVATFAFIEALKLVTNPISRRPAAQSESQAETLASEFAARWQAIAQEHDAFIEATWLAEVYLDQEHFKFMDELLLRKADIRAAQSSHLQNLRFGESIDGTAYDRCFNLDKELDALKERAKSLFRDLARVPRS